MPDFPMSSLGLSFDRGIDRITYTRTDGGPQLPERGDAQPTDVGARPRMEALLALPTLDDALDEAIRPQLANRDLLLPGKFNDALDGALQRLKDSAEKLQQDGGDSAASTEQNRVLNRAARQLNEERGLRDLVQMYRSVLYQG